MPGRPHISLSPSSSQLEASSRLWGFHHPVCIFSTGINEIVTCQAAMCQTQSQAMERYPGPHTALVMESPGKDMQTVVRFILLQFSGSFFLHKSPFKWKV